LEKIIASDTRFDRINIGFFDFRCLRLCAAEYVSGCKAYEDVCGEKIRFSSAAFGKHRNHWLFRVFNLSKFSADLAQLSTLSTKPVDYKPFKGV
jgi:hypothetical protein